MFLQYQFVAMEDNNSEFHTKTVSYDIILMLCISIRRISLKNLRMISTYQAHTTLGLMFVPSNFSQKMGECIAIKKIQALVFAVTYKNDSPVPLQLCLFCPSSPSSGATHNMDFPTKPKFSIVSANLHDCSCRCHRRHRCSREYPSIPYQKDTYSKLVVAKVLHQIPITSLMT